MPFSVPQIRDDGFEDESVAPEKSPVYTGVTQFEPLAGVRVILITGGAGFIASWVVRHLCLSYPGAYHVVCFDKLDYCASLNNIQCVQGRKNFSFCYGDITNKTDVMRCLKKYCVDTIFHFAAQSHVDLSFGNSFQFTTTNVLGTHVMLECAVDHGIRRFIHISTDEVNGEVNFGDPDLLENSLLAPTNPYAASKAAAEMFVNAYAKSFKLPVIIVRSNNVYGPHQFPEKIIPKFSCLLHRHRPLVLHGNGNNTRRYLYAGDAADAFDTILHRGQIGEIYNVDSRDEISNLDLSMKLLSQLDIPVSSAHSWIQYTKDRPFNDKRYAVDATKLRGLGWEQKTSFEEGLKITVDWYREFGKDWWGDVEGVLTPFPVVREGEVYPDGESKRRDVTSNLEMQINGSLVANGSGGSKKRALDQEDKENADNESAKRVMLGDDLVNRNGGAVVQEPQESDHERA